MENIDLYYESIKQVYEQIVKWKPPSTPLLKRAVNYFGGFLTSLAVASVLPILPAVVAYFAGGEELQIGKYWKVTRTLESFLLLWLVSSVVFIALAILVSKIENKITVPASRPPQTLSPEQLTFVAVYEAYKELKIYFVSHIDQHVTNSLKSLSKTLPHNRWRYVRGIQPTEDGSMLVFDNKNDADMFEVEVHEIHQLMRMESGGYLRASLSYSLMRQVSSASSFLETFEKYAWFQLDARTKSILQALISVGEKLAPRLKLREDLPTVLTVLKNLSEFIYAYLPEHKTHMDSGTLSSLQREGAESLERFVQEINGLTAYSMPTGEGKRKGKDRKSRTLKERFHEYYTQSVFFRFTLWFVLNLALTSGAVYLLTYFAPLSPDTMATVVIGTSVASAAALAGFLPRSSKSE